MPRGRLRGWRSTRRSNLMASDRSPLSKRLKSLAQRAGLPVDDAPPAEREPAIAVPPSTSPATPAVPPAAEAPADEQPTGDVPVVAEQPTDDQPVLRIADEQPTVVSDAVAAPADPFAHQDGPTLAPPVVPARPVDEPAPPASDPAPAAAQDDEDDDEPFSPRSTIWPQSAPTPRFDRRDERPAAHSTSDPTFPAPSPAPAADEDPSAVEPESFSRDDAADTTTPAAPEVSEETPEPEPATTGVSPEPARAVEVVPSDDVTSEQPALADDPSAGKTGRFGALRRLRSSRGAAAPTADVTAPEEVPAVPVATAPEPAAEPAPVATPAPAPAVAAAPYEPPAKPSFAERAALRRRAKTLRARRDAGLLELGAIVLDQRRFGDPTGGSLTRRRTDELADIDGELAAIEQVLDDDGPAETVAQLGVVRCLSCTALVGPRDRFCVQCGAPRPEADGSPSNAA